MAGDGAVDVAEGRGDDAAGEGGGVVVVFGVEDERDIDDAGVLVARLVAGDHVEQVRGVDSDSSGFTISRPSMTFCMCPMIVGIWAVRVLASEVGLGETSCERGRCCRAC